MSYANSSTEIITAIYHNASSWHGKLAICITKIFFKTKQNPTVKIKKD